MSAASVPREKRRTENGISETDEWSLQPLRRPRGHGRVVVDALNGPRCSAHHRYPSHSIDRSTLMRSTAPFSRQVRH